MLKSSLLLKETINPKRLYNTVKEVSSFHRIQASTGFREAANYCKKSFDKLKIESRILEFDATADNWGLQTKMFKEWDLKNAWLRLEEPDILLADAQAEAISIIQKSYPCDFTQGTELVYLNQGSNQENYAEWDLNGKIIFIREHFNNYMWAMKDKGAIGVVTDNMRLVEGIRTRNDLYESLNYTSFWWTHQDDEPQCFGFVLSPKMGDQLALLFEQQAKAFKEGKANTPNLRCKGKVETSLYDGKIEVVEAVLPGETDEEVLICAHLCHPKSSCNDNASGVAAAMESIRAIKQLIEEGKLEKNKRTIKVILVPELNGTAAYMDNKENYKNCVGAINMDMVGGKQTRKYGPITLTSLPYSTPSFINDLTALCMDYAAKEVSNLNGDKVALTNHHVDLYTGGSDHVIFSDPTIGIPCCMIGQWPDLNYHTATDTLDVIDPEVLAFSTSISALFAYTLANLTEENAKEIQNRAHTSLMKHLSLITTKINEGSIAINKANAALKHVENFYLNSLYDYNRFLQLDEAFLKKEEALITATINNMKIYLDACESECAEPDNRVFVRNYAGPIDKMSDVVNRYKKGYKELEIYDRICANGIKGHGMERLIQFYIDGKRTVSEIIDCVDFDMFCSSKDNVLALINLLEAMGLIHQI